MIINNDYILIWLFIKDLRIIILIIYRYCLNIATYILKSCDTFIISLYILLYKCRYYYIDIIIWMYIYY